MKPAQANCELKSNALGALLRRHALTILAISALAVTPCLWHARIQAGDLGSHVYNAWLAQLAERGQAEGLVIARQWSNVLLDVALVGTAKWFGLPGAERVIVPAFVLVFFWGCFALASAAARKPAWAVTPAIAMLAYGWTFNAGFINFYVSLGFAFFAIAAFWRATGKSRLWVSLCALPILVAHPAGFVLFVGAAAYIGVAERVPAKIRVPILLPLAALTLVAIRLFLAARFKVAYSMDPLYYFNGCDQFWLFGPRYAVLSVAVLAGTLGFISLDAYRKRRAGAPLSAFHTPLELYAVALTAVLLLPFNVRTPQSYGYLQQRGTTVLAAFALCALACAGLRKWIFGWLSAAAAVFFVFLYQDTGSLNRMEERVNELVAGTPPGARLSYVIPVPKGSRVQFFSHLVDRACIGRCFAYQNYEPSSGAFRLRVRGPNRFVIEHQNPSCEMQRGYYVLRPEDLPMYHVYQPVEEPGVLQIRELKAGDQNGYMGVRPPASRFCLMFWGPYQRPDDVRADLRQTTAR